MGITPTVKILLLVNIGVFLLQNIVREINYWGVFSTQAAVYNLQLWRFVTYMFMHGDFSHILFNMFGLWMFGSQIEALWGQRIFLTYYFVCGLGGAVLYAIFDMVGVGAGAPMLGASGAIYGILLAYGINFPNNVLLMGFLIPIKAKYAVILFGLIELLATASGSGGGVAHLAHLGGMLAGFIFMWLTIPGVGQQIASAGFDPGGIWRRTRTRRKMRVVRPRRDGGNGKTRPGAGPDTGPVSADQQEIDRILDKISREGLQSLSDDEQEILRRAGRR